MSAPSQPAAVAALAAAPALVARAGHAVWLSADGEIEELSPGLAARRAEAEPPLVCHWPSIAGRLGVTGLPAYDLLELFAFARPAQFCLPTPRGLAAALKIAVPKDAAGEAVALQQSAFGLLRELAHLPTEERRRVAEIAATMARGGWRWAGPVLSALRETPASGRAGAGLDAWNRLPEWTELAPPVPATDAPVAGHEARERLRDLAGPAAERRPAQADYAAVAAAAFAPRELEGAPNLVLAEAGTGTGKTLGYIAPASLWAERSGGVVWLSTYTKNLQRQIDQELDRLYPDAREKAERVVIRKGRENYLCLLNLEEATQGGAMRPQDAVALGLMARWTEATRDGDMVGGDFPAWLVGLLGAARTTGLADRRGECVYSTCAHYRRCFIERSIRKARRAEMVIANHALVMLQAARATDPRELPTRYVFDEGHHLFDAADSAFSAILSGLETIELRRWLRGEDARRRRLRGLERRIGDLAESDARLARALAAVTQAATALPAEGWVGRIERDAPDGPTESFLAKVRQQVLARARPDDNAYGQEAATVEPVEDLLPRADALAEALDRIARPLRDLAKALQAKLDDEAGELETTTRVRIEAAIRGLDWRIRMVEAWRGMLKDLSAAPPDAFVDWFTVERHDGRVLDIAFHRHWVDPTRPFAEAVLRPAHGALITSATLRDQTTGDAEAGWRNAEVRTGALHFAMPAVRISAPSPFDYAAQTRILVVTDVRRDDVAQVSAACRELFLASGGGALGLFTAIWRLRAVHKRIVEPLEAAGLPLLAQHVDPLDTASLIDIFRAESESCLLGTDAVRDGVDVPGAALRLIVFDRVPWPRPDILHKARRAAFGGSAYDDMITRLRLKQAFGRLVRRAGDRGVFVMLDAMLPSRLLGAFPAEVDVRRVGLADAVHETRRFLEGYR